jgi:predicted RNase H-like nuclease
LSDKKKTVEEKRQGLLHYVTKLKGLEDREPVLQAGSVSLFDTDIDELKGQALKKHEDLLDALFCAYTALYLWHHRGDESRWRVIKQDDSPDFITIPLT